MPVINQRWSVDRRNPRAPRLPRSWDGAERAMLGEQRADTYTRRLPCVLSSSWGGLHVDGERGGLGEPKGLLHSAQASQPGEASLPVAIPMCPLQSLLPSRHQPPMLPPTPLPFLPSVQRSTGWGAGSSAEKSRLGRALSQSPTVKRWGKWPGLWARRPRCRSLSLKVNSASVPCPESHL